MQFLSRLMGRRLPPEPPVLPRSASALSIETPLLIAVQNDRQEAIGQLLDGAAQPSFSRDEALAFQRQLQPALKWAMEHARVEAMDLLLAHPVARATRAHAGISGLLKLAEHAPGPIVGKIIREVPMVRPTLGQALKLSPLSVSEPLPVTPTAPRLTR